MITELELVRDFVAASAPARTDLATAGHRLQAAIAAEVAWSHRSARLPLWATRIRRTTQRHSLAGVGLAASAVVIVAAVLLTLLPAGSNAPAAAATLQATAQAAAARGSAFQAPTYIEDRSLYRVDVYTPEPPGHGLNLAATATFTEIEQEWVNPTSPSRGLLIRGPLQYLSGRDRAAWDRTASGRQFSQTFQRTVAEPGLSNVLDVSRLPTDASALERLIATGHTGTWVDFIPSDPGATFERAALLLSGPDIGLTPALASALFNVLAHQPGARRLGQARDHLGRTGTGITAPSSSGFTEVIVDARTGSLLETQLPPAPLLLKLPTGGTARICHGSACNYRKQVLPQAVSVLAPVWIDPVMSSALAQSGVR